MPEKAQQQTLSVRISDTLRRRLERARQLAAQKTGEPVSTSEIAKQFLEAARDDRLELVDLLDDPTASLLQIQRKGQGRTVLSRAEWTAVAHFVRHGMEASPAQLGKPVSQDSVVAILDAFLAVYELRVDEKAAAALDAYYLDNLPPECRPRGGRLGDASEANTPDVVRRTVAETRKVVSDPATTWQPPMVGRNLFVLLDEDRLPGAEPLSRALRPFWPVLWRVAARGHYAVTGRPLRAATAFHDGAYALPIPSVTEGGYSLSFARGQGQEFSVLLIWPGIRSPRYPITGYPRIAEFRAMLDDLVTDHEPGDWRGAHFTADVSAPRAPEAAEIEFRAHDNGISFSFSVEEWHTLHRLFTRAWERPDVRRAWEALALEYGEL